MKDIYLKFGNPAIKGESQDKDHAGWIKLNSVSFSAHRDTDTHLGQAAQRQGGTVALGEITITKPCCAASPHLFTASVVGPGKKVEIDVTGNERPNYVEFVLEDCCVTSYGVSSNGVSHVETVSLNFLKMEMTQKNDKGTPNKVGFSIPKGVAS